MQTVDGLFEFLMALFRLFRQHGEFLAILLWKGLDFVHQLTELLLKHPLVHASFLLFAKLVVGVFHSLGLCQSTRLGFSPWTYVDTANGMLQCRCQCRRELHKSGLETYHFS